MSILSDEELDRMHQRYLNDDVYRAFFEILLAAIKSGISIKTMQECLNWLKHIKFKLANTEPATRTVGSSDEDV